MRPKKKKFKYIYAAERQLIQYNYFDGLKWKSLVYSFAVFFRFLFILSKM